MSRIPWDKLLSFSTLDVVKLVVSAAIIVLVTKIQLVNDRLSALLIALPFTSLLAMCWMKADKQTPERIANHSEGTFWFVLPTLPMFLIQLKHELWKLFGKKRTFIGFGVFPLAQNAVAQACLRVGNTSRSITLGAQSRTTSVCCGTLGSCGTSCVANNSTFALPPTCNLPATLIAKYDFNESSYNGTLNVQKRLADGEAFEEALVEDVEVHRECEVRLKHIAESDGSPVREQRAGPCLVMRADDAGAERMQMAGDGPALEMKSG